MEYTQILKQFSRLPRFPDGRIDFSKSKEAPIINVIIMHEHEILLLKRSGKVRTSKNRWDCLGGYLDEEVPPEKKTMIELKEELGIGKDIIKEIRSAPSFIASRQGLDWIVFPVLVILKKKPEIKLDWEHTDYRWEDTKKLRGFAHAEKIKKLLSTFSP